MENYNILLSICIPTYNRSKFLNENLRGIFNQIRGRDLPIEIIVSDNCSTDNTTVVVEKCIEDGMSINYIRNVRNLGMDGNFAQCYRKANGKYVLVLGDDDYFIDGQLDKLLEYLGNGDYGLVHLQIGNLSNNGAEELIDTEVFLKNISFWITYITSNIVNRQCVDKYNFEKYSGTYLAIVPLYIEAAFSSKSNLLIHETIFQEGKDSKTNGGYNFFLVFVDNYLSIWKKYLFEKKISKELYFNIKYDIYRKFIVRNTFNILILKQIGNYKIDSAWKILMSNYGLCPYFYYLLVNNIIKEFSKKTFIYIFGK